MADLIATDIAETRQGSYYAPWEEQDDDPKRELPATAALYNPKTKKRQAVKLDDEVVGYPGHVVSEISAKKGVYVLPPEGGGDGFWVAPGNAPSPGADEARQAYAERQRQLRSAAPTAPSAPKSRVTTDTALASHRDYYTTVKNQLQAAQKLAEAQKYQTDHIYTAAENEQWAQDAAAADIESMNEVAYWDDHENTGYRLHKMETEDGEPRMFLTSPDGETIYNVTGLIPDPDTDVDDE